MGRQCEGHSSRNVRLDESRDDVHRRTLRGQNEVDSRGPRLLRQAADVVLHILRCGHHEIRQLIHHDDHVWKPILGKGLGIVRLEMPHPGPGKHFVPALHFPDRPGKGMHCLFGIHDGRREDMGNPLVQRHLHPFRVDENETQLLRASEKGESDETA